MASLRESSLGAGRSRTLAVGQEAEPPVPVSEKTPAVAGARPARLFNINFTLLLQGQFISRAGASLSAMVLLLWIKDATGSASLMGLMSMLSSIPAVLFGIIGGTVADRFSRRRIIAYCDILAGVALLGLGVLFTHYPDNVALLTAGVVFVSVFVAVMDSFSTPAITAATPDIVPEGLITRANALGQFLLSISLLLGQGLGGLVYRVLGTISAVAFNGIASLYAGLTETLIVIPQGLPPQPKTWGEQFSAFKRDTVAGVRHVFRTPGLNKMVVASSLLAFFTAPLILLIPYYVVDFLGLSEDAVGYLAATYGFGSLIGSLSAGIGELKRRHRSTAIILAMILQSVGFAVLGLITTPWITFSLVFVGGALGGFVGVYVITILQVTTPSESRGRVFGVLGTIAGALAPAGMGLGGVVFDWIGQDVGAMYLGCGGIATLLMFLLALSRDFQDYLAYETDRNHQSLNAHTQQTEVP